MRKYEIKGGKIMDADCSLGDGVKELVYVYKQLYHAAVERCGIHQDQLEQYSELLPKVKKIAELHVSTVVLQLLYFILIIVLHRILTRFKGMINQRRS